MVFYEGISLNVKECSGNVQLSIRHLLQDIIKKSGQGYTAVVYDFLRYHLLLKDSLWIDSV